MNEVRVTAERYHDICCGHRVVGHEGKCKNLHGHNYRFTFTIEAGALDCLGRVLDFSVIKSTLCEWLEKHWDHRMLIWENDPLLHALLSVDDAIVVVPFNPTAENIAIYVLQQVAPALLHSKARLIAVKVEETRKCSATAKLF